ncbi:MAG: hypothetical protein LBE01_01875 [Deltaproteobacteria bacterium]|jgi:predicted deacylase|nr:hypothetical protein [Deltaproteobacteria bacterium]
MGLALRRLALSLLVFGLLTLFGDLWAANLGQDRQHIVYFEGTPQELEIYKIYGRQEGPTIMIIGGIQGDEPGGFLSADLYVDLSLQRGNLIVVPRANFRSIIAFDRGDEGDMNRKFAGVKELDPDRGTVEIIKNLMAESDLLLNLHDGSGFFRPVWESDMANPSRYGQCVIADAEVYAHPATGRVLHLGQEARKAVELINKRIPEEKYKFHFSNHDTISENSKHKEQRASATFYALTKLGIPAYGLETSKQLPSLEMKVRQHNLAVNAFMELYGVIAESPRVNLAPPSLSYLIVSVNGRLPVAVSDGQTLLVNPGDLVEVIHVGANYDRGLSVDVVGVGSINDIRLPLAIHKETKIIARRDNVPFGQVQVGLLPPGSVSPQLKRPDSTLTAQAGAGVDLRAAGQPAAGEAPAAGGPPMGPKATSQVGGGPSSSDPSSRPGGGSESFYGFRLEVDGRPVELKADERLTVGQGSKVRLVGLASPEPLPVGTVMNLRGFIGRPGDTTGDDLGTTAKVGSDMIARFAMPGRQIPTYQLGAEDGKKLLFKAYLEILEPKLKKVTLTVDGKTHELALGGRLKVKAGSQVLVEAVELAGGLPLTNAKLTLGGRPFSAALPQTVAMPNLAVALAVFSDGQLAGKVVLAPAN